MLKSKPLRRITKSCEFNGFGFRSICGEITTDILIKRNFKSPKSSITVKTRVNIFYNLILKNIKIKLSYFKRIGLNFL